MAKNSERPYNEFKKIYTELGADVSHILGAWSEGSRQLIPDPVRLDARERRVAVRAIFSLTEGIAYFMRQILLTSSITTLPDHVRLALQEQQIDVTPNGSIKFKPLKVSAVSLFRLTLKTYQAALPEFDASQLTDSDFERMTHAARVRDRLMHPKGMADLTVTDSEIRQVVKVFAWFNAVMMSVLHTLAIALERNLGVPDGRASPGL